VRLEQVRAEEAGFHHGDLDAEPTSVATDSDRPSTANFVAA
jgi:hypothetical protein